VSLRTFKKYTIAAGGTPQPLVGTTTTSAIGPVPYPQGQVGSLAILVIPVTDGSMFYSGCYAVIGKPSTGEERLYVPVVSGNNVTVQIPFNGGITGTYASGAYIRVGQMINSTYVQTIVGNAGTIYIGTRDNLSKSTLAYVIAQLTAVSSGQPVEYRDGRSGLANADDLSQLWVDGTTGDGYLPSVGIV
jgi:hypothetical protein